MKIVINVPDYIKEQADDGKGEELGIPLWLAYEIANGIPLPKGHGRLIDYGYVVDAIDDWVNAEEYRYTNATDYLRKRVANTPTIIEADTESEG